MKKYLSWLLVVLLLGACIFITVDKNNKIKQYQTEIKQLKQNNKNINQLFEFGFQLLYKYKDYQIVDFKVDSGDTILYGFIYNGYDHDLKKGIRLVNNKGNDYTIEMPGDISSESFDINDSKIITLNDKQLVLQLSINKVKRTIKYDIEINNNKIAVFNLTSKAFDAWKANSN